MSAAALDCRRYDDFTPLERERAQWDDLMLSLDAGIAMSFDWCRVWWRHYGHGRRLALYVLRQGERWVGVVPLYLEKLGPGGARVWRHLAVDHTLGAVEPAILAEHLEAGLALLLAALERDARWDLLCLGPIAGKCGSTGAWATSLARLGGEDLEVSLADYFPQTYFDLRSDWPGQLAAIPRLERSNIRKNYNAIEHWTAGGHGALRAEFAEPAQLDAWFDEFMRLHQEHWRAQGKRGHFGDWPGAEAFHREMLHAQARQGRLRLLRVSLGETCLGYQYHYRFGPTYLHFLDARAAADALPVNTSFGRITFCELLKQAIAEGATRIDSLQGHYEHKLRLGGREAGMVWLFARRRRPLAGGRLALARAWAWLVHKFYYRLWFIRLSPRLPFGKRPLWRVWIRHRFLLDLRRGRPVS